MCCITLIQFEMRLLSNRILPMREFGNVAARRQTDAQRVVGSRISVVFVQPLSQGMGSDADDSIQLWVKIWRAAKGLNCNVVFLYLSSGPFEVLLANEREQANQIIGASKQLGRKNSVEFSTFCLEVTDR